MKFSDFELTEQVQEDIRMHLKRGYKPKEILELYLKNKWKLNFICASLRIMKWMA
jgi:hypothetical protein